jgi:hypothetical protein
LNFGSIPSVLLPKGTSGTHEYGMQLRRCVQFAKIFAFLAHTLA